MSVDERSAERVLDAALAAGADEADLRVESGREFTVQVRMGELEVLKEAAGRSLNLRVFKDGRKAMVSSTEGDTAALAALAAEAVGLAERCQPDEHNRLPDPDCYARELPELDLHDPAAPPDTPARIERALAAERAALAADPRITNSQGAGYAVYDGEAGYFTTGGFSQRARISQHSLSMMPVATDSAGERVTDGWAKRARHLADMQAPAEIGAEAARRVLRRLDARSAPTGRFPVLFEPRMGARLVGMLFGCISGDSVWRGRSYLAERLGETIAADCVTVIDDPHRPRGLGSRPCDGEGLPGARRVFVDGGRLTGFATDLESARRLAIETTGHGRWGGGVAASNLYLAAGDRSAAEIVAGTARGLLVTGMMGGGFQAASGHWSQGCLGLWIEDGAIAYPVREVTIAGSFDAVLGAVDAVGDDLDFSLGAVVAPTLRVAEMVVAGAGGPDGGKR